MSHHPASRFLPVMPTGPTMRARSKCFSPAQYPNHPEKRSQSRQGAPWTTVIRRDGLSILALCGGSRRGPCATEQSMRLLTPGFILCPSYDANLFP
jgi:hypothetical protein